MLSAEDLKSSISVITDPRFMGRLPIDVGGFYSELLVFNYLNEDLYAVDFQNKAALIQRDPSSNITAIRKIEISSRQHTGRRLFNVHGIETSIGRHDIITISYEQLRQQPIFVEALNAVLCLRDQLTIARHPHSKVHQDEVLYQQKVRAAQQAVDAPIVLNANDPSGQISQLHIVLNGEICSCTVTNFADEPDQLVLTLRNNTTPGLPLTIHKTSFLELLAEDDRLWQFHGFTLCSQRPWLEQVLAIEKAKQPETVPVQAVSELIRSARTDDDRKITELTTHNKELVGKVRQLELTLKELAAADYGEKQAAFLRDKLAFEQAKLREGARAAEFNTQKEQQKYRQEIIATIGIIVKTAAVVIPIAFALYKAIITVQKTT